MDNEETNEEQIESVNENKLATLIETIQPVMTFIEMMQPTITRWLKGDQQISLRDQWGDIGLMAFTLIIIFVLAFVGVIDSSGATGLLGAIIGYVFGGFFHRKIQKRE